MISTVGDGSNCDGTSANQSRASPHESLDGWGKGVRAETLVPQVLVTDEFQKGLVFVRLICFFFRRLGLCFDLTKSGRPQHSHNGIEKY